MWATSKEGSKVSMYKLVSRPLDEPHSDKAVCSALRVHMARSLCARGNQIDGLDRQTGTQKGMLACICQYHENVEIMIDSRSAVKS